MQRREFITLLGGTVAAWPHGARAQQAMPVIGVLSSASPRDYVPMLAAFRKGLGDGGYVEGQNVKIEYLWAEERYERLPVLAADLVRRRVNVIVASAHPGCAWQPKPATATIPIVFATGGDPERTRLVGSLKQARCQSHRREPYHERRDCAEAA